MKIKNRYSKNRKSTKDRIFESYQRLRKKIRLKARNIIPLSKNEELLYSNDEELKMENTKIDKNKYFELNGQIYILDIYPKAKISNLYVELNELIKKNPLNNTISSTLFQNDLKSTVFGFTTADNKNRYSMYFYITPCIKELNKILDKISILLFELSNDFIGICFGVNLSDEINKEINNLIISDCDGEEEYIKYYSRNKTLTTKMLWNPDITRRKIVNDYIIEIKTKVINFICKYISLNKKSNNPPISIDVYTTNYNLSENSNFLSSYDIFYFESTNDIIPIEYIFDEKNNEFIDSQFIFQCEKDPQEINRSARIIINKTNKLQKIFIHQSYLINFFIITLYHYNINEFGGKISIIRDNLYKFYSEKESKIYREYENSIKEIQKYKMMFNNVKLSNKFYNCKKLQEGFINQNKRYRELLENYEQLEISYNNKMLVSNYKSTSSLAKISIFVAIFSLIITICLTFLKDPNIESIDNNIYIQLEEIRKQNNKIDYIIEKIKYFIDKSGK